MRDELSLPLFKLVSKFQLKNKEALSQDGGGPNSLKISAPLPLRKTFRMRPLSARKYLVVAVCSQVVVIFVIFFTNTAAMSYRYFATLQKTAKRGKIGKDENRTGESGRVPTGGVGSTVYQDDKMMKLLTDNKFMCWEASKRLHSLTFQNRCSRFPAKNLKNLACFYLPVLIARKPTYCMKKDSKGGGRRDGWRETRARED